VSVKYNERRRVSTLPSRTNPSVVGVESVVAQPSGMMLRNSVDASKQGAPEVRSALRDGVVAGDIAPCDLASGVGSPVVHSPVGRRGFGSLRPWLVGFVASIGLGSCSGPLSPARVESASSAPVRAAVQPRERVVADEPPAYVTRSREVWRAAAQASDWDDVALKIDALPELERNEPGTRYVRALAARRLNDCPRALSVLDGLAEALPLLAVEIDAIRAECQLSVGPFDDTASDAMNGVSLEGRLEAARTWEQAGQLERARLLVEGILEDTSEDENDSRSRRDVYVHARELRADLAERLGQLELARADRRWLALVAVVPEADVAFERLSGVRLTKAERAERAASLAERGLVSAVERELARLKKAPGTSPPRDELVRTLAWAHYRSRDSYERAAKLFEQAAGLDGNDRASDLFKAASAWSRSKQVKRALAAYDQIVRRYPNSRAAEQALHSKANTFYSSGRWSEAVRAYNQYLSRYERGKKARKARFVRQSRYERAVALLAQGNGAEARVGFEQVRKSRGNGYVTSMLEHLEAVALASSGISRLENEAVERFRDVVQRYPLSFAALLSSARLAQLGETAPRLGPLPVAAAEPAEWPELPAKARLLADLGLNSAAEVTLHEEEPLLRELYSPRASETLCRQYELLDRGFRRYSLAAGAVGDGILRRAPTTENLWAWQCLYPRPFSSTVDQLERRYALPDGLVYSVMRQESEFRPDARSHVGAVGLMQLMPGTAERAARELALDHASERLTQAEYNIELGAFYLGKLLGSFDQRVPLAVASYNAGPHAVSRWLGGGGKRLPLDIWAARIPYEETRNYLARVMSNWARYRYLGGGPDNVPTLALALPKELALPGDAY
jgi:soluble lytic murein transglycosylase